MTVIFNKDEQDVHLNGEGRYTVRGFKRLLQNVSTLVFVYDADTGVYHCLKNSLELSKDLTLDGLTLLLGKGRV